MNNDTKNINYDDLIILNDLDSKSYNRIYYYLYKKKLKKIMTPQGIAVDKKRAIEILKTQRIKKTEKNVYQIDLSQHSKINSLYRRLCDMNKYNRNMALKDDRLQRYRTEDGKKAICMTDYLAPQIKILAKKIECPKAKVMGAIFDLLHNLYLEEKQERKEQEEKELKKKNV